MDSLEAKYCMPNSEKFEPAEGDEYWKLLGPQLQSLCDKPQSSPAPPPQAKQDSDALDKYDKVKLAKMVAIFINLRKL